MTTTFEIKKPEEIIMKKPLFKTGDIVYIARKTRDKPIKATITHLEQITPNEIYEVSFFDEKTQSDVFASVSTDILFTKRKAAVESIEKQSYDSCINFLMMAFHEHLSSVSAEKLCMDYGAVSMAYLNKITPAKTDKNKLAKAKLKLYDIAHDTSLNNETAVAEIKKVLSEILTVES